MDHGKFIGRLGGPHVIIPGGPPMHLTATGKEQRRFQEELGVEVEPMRSPLGTPGESNAGLLGYLRSIARNN